MILTGIYARDRFLYGVSAAQFRADNTKIAPEVLEELEKTYQKFYKSMQQLFIARKHVILVTKKKNDQHEVQCSCGWQPHYRILKPFALTAGRKHAIIEVCDHADSETFEILKQICTADQAKKETRISRAS